MPFDEYISHRETRLHSWELCYSKLLDVPSPKEFRLTPAVEAMEEGSHWFPMGFYERWITSLYGEELNKKFGSWQIVDPALIPIGMVELFRNSRMKLDQ